MDSFDPRTLLTQVALGEASDEEMVRLGEIMDKDPALARELREELEFSEWIRHAVSDPFSSGESALIESFELGDLTAQDRIHMVRDGDLSKSTADEAARILLDAPELAAELRSSLFEDERIAQIVSPAKSEDAFVDSLVTRMWAETSEDHFVKDFSKKLEELEREETNVIPFPGRSWKTRGAAVAALAAAVAIGAFVITSNFEGGLTSTVAKISKATDDAIWAIDSPPGKDGSLRNGTYRLESGAVSLNLASGETLAIEGPAVFEVDKKGQAVLLNGIALATNGTPKTPGSSKIGIGLSAKNVRFSEGAITVGLDARSPESTEAVVFSGETGICLTDGKICRDVFEFESVKADHSHEKFVDVPYNPRAFTRAWELVSGIEKNTGDIVVELPGVSASSRHSDSGELRVFVERDRFQPEQPMKVDALRPGFFASSGEANEGRSLDSDSGEMRSYLLQLWSSEENEKEIEASMTFDHPVVGVIFSSERLWESDQMVGASTVHLAEAAGNRGLDSLGDQILLSEDGRTLNLKLKGNESEIDQVRVLVALK
ncbi:MAG: hypothetical protein P1V20_28415 [Verrucomicrobiales bacterium]|nr:hypothetical protein [Verrucomicrobiales bacterium]